MDRTLTLSIALVFLTACDVRLTLGGANDTGKGAEGSSNTGGENGGEIPETTTLFPSPHAQSGADQFDPIVDSAEDKLLNGADSGSSSSSGGEVSLDPLDLDACGEEDWSSAVWEETTSTHFRFNFIPGTAAAEQLDLIAADREAAYNAIRAFLDIDAAPIVDVYLAPNRSAAAAAGLGMGTAYPGWDRYEVVYTGVAGSYERVRYGHELAHVLAYYVDPSYTYRLPLFDEGVAELLDQSDRNLHLAYAQQLTAGIESRTHIADFEQSDVWGSNYGRAGSFVQFLVDQYGPDAFLQLWRAVPVTWQGGYPAHPVHGRIGTAGELTGLLDVVFTETVGEPWVVVRERWLQVVHSALDQGPIALTTEDLNSLEELVQHMDQAVNQDDPDQYRVLMDGFYCVWAGDEARLDIAKRMVSAFEGTTSRVVAVTDTGIKNFRSAHVVVMREEARGAVSMVELFAERAGLGWRLTWSPEWQ